MGLIYFLAYGGKTAFYLVRFSGFLKNTFQLKTSHEKLQEVVDSCLKSREKACAAMCSQQMSICAGFQHGPQNTCCLLGLDEMLNGIRQQAPGWKIWTKI